MRRAEGVQPSRSPPCSNISDSRLSSGQADSTTLSSVQLRAYLATLRSSLVGVINEEYEAFIGLSLGLKHANVAQSLSTIRRPVLSIRSEVTKVKAELDEMREEMSTVLNERKECREMKVLLRRLLATEEAVEKVESMLQIGDGESTSRTTDVEE